MKILLKTKESCILNKFELIDGAYIFYIETVVYYFAYFKKSSLFFFFLLNFMKDHFLIYGLKFQSIYNL